MYCEYIPELAQVELRYPHNAGQQAEHAFKEVKRFAQVVALNARYDIASDVEQVALSIKSARFTLANGNLMQGETLEQMIDYYIKTTAAQRTAYITKDNRVFYMTHNELKAFLFQFGKLEKDSQMNGGKVKVRMGHETKAVLAWLEGQASR